MAYSRRSRQTHYMAKIGGKQCVICGLQLNGRQRSFCSRTCKNRHTNYHHQSNAKQIQRGRSNKSKLVRLMGGKCLQCGYARNLSALEFHHRDPSSKAFQLDARSLANRQWSAIENEAAKCDLPCSNCHAETHHPEAMIDAVAESLVPVGLSGKDQDTGSSRSSLPLSSSVSR